KNAGRITPSPEVLLAAAHAQNARNFSVRIALHVAAARLFRRELPSIYPFSGGKKKCVGPKLQVLRASRFTNDGLSDICRAGMPAQFCEEALHPLPDGVGRGRIQFGNLFSGVADEPDLKQKIDLLVAEEFFGDAPMQEMPQHCMALHEIVARQRRQNLWLLFPSRPMNRTFAASPFKELALHRAGDRESKVRLAFFDLLRTQHLQKNGQRLLCNVRARKPQLLLGDAANGSMQ